MACKYSGFNSIEHFGFGHITTRMFWCIWVATCLDMPWVQKECSHLPTLNISDTGLSSRHIPQKNFEDWSLLFVSLSWSWWQSRGDFFFSSPSVNVAVEELITILLLAPWWQGLSEGAAEREVVKLETMAAKRSRRDRAWWVLEVTSESKRTMMMILGRLIDETVTLLEIYFCWTRKICNLLLYNTPPKQKICYIMITILFFNPGRFYA